MSMNISKKIGLLGVFIVSAASGYFAGHSMKNDSTDTTPTIGIEDLSYTEGKGYAFSVSVSPRPTAPYAFVLKSVREGVVIQESEDGHFTDVPYSEDDGKYQIQLISTKDFSTLAEDSVSGFEKATLQKMTAEELQAIINSRDVAKLTSDCNEQLSAEIKLMFKGIRPNEKNLPTTLPEVVNRLKDNIWSQVSVTALGYDEDNRINCVTMQIQKTVVAVKKMSVREFERRLRERDAQVTKGVRFRVEGMRPGEKALGELAGVCDKVNWGIWESFNVESVIYDTEGRIVSCVIRPIYKEEE